MAKVTRISTQQKNKSRYNIFLDEGKGESYGFSVDEDILVEFYLRKGMELEQETIELLKQKDTLHKTYTLAIHFLSYRMRSKKEIRDYLVKKEVDEEQINQVMSRLEKEGLLDDRSFAEAFVETRMNTTSKGPLLVKKELLEKGVAANIVEVALHKYSYELQLQKAQKFAQKKWSSTSKKSFRQQIQALHQNLMQKGFSQDVIKDVLSEIKEDKDEDAEWDALVLQGEKFVRKYGLKAEGYELKHKVKGALYRKGFPLDSIERFLEEYIE